MAETKPNKDDLSIPTISVDANGWTIYDFGKFKQYRKKATLVESLTGGQWKWSANSISLPTGMANLVGKFTEATYTPSDTAITLAMNAYERSVITFAMTNQYGATINNFTIYCSICITTTS